MKKIDVGVVVTTLIIVTISCSLAFFAARVVGNPKDINLVAKNVSITFTDTSSIASDTISPGWNNVKTFTITNNSKEDFNYNIVLKGLVNTFESINTLQYKITSDVGYSMDNYLNVIKTETSKDVVLAYNITIPKNTIQSYQVEFNYISTEEDQSGDMGKKLGGTLAIEASDGTPEIYDKLLADNPTIKTRTDFSTIFNETNVNTLYNATEDNTDVYYFAGDARNNWVKFGTWQEDKTIVVGYLPNTTNGDVAKEFATMSECNSDTEYGNCKEVVIAKKGDPMYWRIIRTNSDESIRLLYAGTSTDTEIGYVGASPITNSTVLDPLYLGYMYGTSGSPENNRLNTNSNTVKTYIDNWYSTNMTSYTKYLSATAVYCNDREVSSDYTYSTTTTFEFSSRDRIQLNKTPTYTCTNTNDKFTVDSGIGNGKLTYPIALMTADEVAFAGGVFYTPSTSPYFWAINNSNNDSITGTQLWWTMTPKAFNSGYGGSYLAVSGSVAPGRIGEPQRFLSLVLRPVISLKGDLIYKSGDGSAEHPYEIEDFTSLTDKVLSDNPTVETRNDFSTVYTDTNTGKIFTSTENNITVYYFAGNATDNWVKFGTWKETKKIVIGYNTEKDNYQTFNTISECNQDATWNENCKEITLANKGDDMYWRIIRTNKDGSVRLLYSGTNISNSFAVIGSSKFTATAEASQGSEDVGYMYGTSGSIENNRLNTNSSLIKQNVDNWYKTNLLNETKYLSTTAIYCNDRQTSNNTGYSGVEYGFAATERLRINKSPTYDCTNASDAFSVSNSLAKLTYPVGLMTADEVVFAGNTYKHVTSNGYFGVNANNENITGKIKWWLMTPAYYTSSNKHGVVYDIIHGKSVGENVINDDNGIALDYGIRPVISIKENAVYKSGNGSAESPYEIVTD